MGNCKTNLKALLIFLLVCAFFSCQEKETKLFRLLSSQQTGIAFNNYILETDSFNIMTEEFIYNGAGVGVGDFNQDGLPDLFFSGNEVANKLYLNQGEMVFEDVSDVSGIAAADSWCTGVAVVDINGDGWLDIYVATAMKKDSLDRANLLFVHQGLDEHGIPVFEEMAAAYGINDMGYSMSATFFDFDRDGLLDLYVLNNLLVTSLPGVFREKITDGTAGNNDKLYRNNGDGTFSDVSQEAGIKIEGYGLGLATADFNADGWPDIYVSNDYLSNDILYLNNGDGTFSNRIEDYIRHQSHFSMGVDMADINNDGLPDLLTLDMLAESNFRMKTTISQNSYQKYINNERWGFEYQYVRNMLHLNNGNGFPFSEIGFLAGIYQTDWSWSPLLVDMDNDGFRDLLVTNGYPRDVTDKDFTNFRADMGSVASTKVLLDSIPIVKIPNYAFRNKGNLNFEDSSRDWGLDLPSFSNGAAFVDLDMDGDLDYVVSNINQEAFIFENTLNNTRENESPHFLRLKLKGLPNNPQGLGAKIKVTLVNGQTLFHEHYTGRGYMSSVEDIVHFGLGRDNAIQGLEILWPDGRWQEMENIPVNQVLSLDILDAKTISEEDIRTFLTGPASSPLLKESRQKVGLDIMHQERDVVDYNVQRTLPHKLSQYGPGMAVGDINGDGLEDLVVAGAAGYARQLLFQKEDGTFRSQPFALSEESQMEDMGLLLFDWDKDGDLDLYAVSGSSEYALGNEVYQDRLYENDGAGNFSLMPDVLPEIREVGTVVRAADFDGDGYLDLFVGGRSGQGQYPLPGKSFLLKNDGEQWTDVTEAVAPGLKEIGMVTDALWTDVDNDGKVDLMVVGEFMAITIFKNVDGKLKLSENTGLGKQVGWWNSVAAADFDQDGDMDYLVGNLGQNNFYQVSEGRHLTLYAGDFDQNHSIDPILFAYFKDEDGNFRQFPVHFWMDLYSQSTLFRKRFPNFKAYGRAGLKEVLTPDERSTSEKLQANQMSSSYLENLGNGKFKLKPLPVLAQIAPVYGMTTTDLDEDGHTDVLMTGNDYGNEVFSGRLDAFVGLWLKGDGRGNFEAILPAESGFYVGGDGKSLVQLKGAGDQMLFIAGQNRDSLRVFEHQDKSRGSKSFFYPHPDDFIVLIHTHKGETIRRELYHGSGFLSQATRSFPLPHDVEEIEVMNYSGEWRKEKVPFGD